MKKNSLPFPYFPVKIALLDQEIKTEALLDTGFSGEVVVSPGSFQNGQTPDTYVTIQVADGSTVIAASYLGEIEMHKKVIKPIVILSLGSETIVGREIMKYFKIILDHGILRII